VIVTLVWLGRCEWRRPHRGGEQHQQRPGLDRSETGTQDHQRPGKTDGHGRDPAHADHLAEDDHRQQRREQRRGEGQRRHLRQRDHRQGGEEGEHGHDVEQAAQEVQAPTLGSQRLRPVANEPGQQRQNREEVAEKRDLERVQPVPDLADASMHGGEGDGAEQHEPHAPQGAGHVPGLRVEECRSRRQMIESARSARRIISEPRAGSGNKIRRRRASGAGLKYALAPQGRNRHSTFCDVLAAGSKMSIDIGRRSRRAVARRGPFGRPSSCP
jgi:hypothetical protein